jgi:Carboxypeptidase regulatory-like domain
MTVPTFYPGTTAANSAQMISVSADQTVNGIDVRLIVAPAFQISGVAVDESGAPVGGAMLTLMADRSPAMMFVTPISTRSNPDGTFTIVNLTAGNYTLRAALPMQVGGQVFGSSGVGAVSSGVFVAGGVTSWSIDSRDGTVAQYASGDSTQTRVTIVDANVEGLKVTVRRP